MHPHQTVFIVVTFFHNLFTAAWIGGLLSLGFNFMPSVKKVLGKGPEMKQLLAVVQKRQSLLVAVSIAGLALTGFLMTKRGPTQGAFFSFSSTYAVLLSIKHILFLVMIGLALLRNLAAGRQKVAPGQTPKNTAAVLMFANVVVGVLILLLSSVLAVLSST